MKKIVASVSMFFFLFSTPSLFAQVPVGVPLAPAGSAGVERIGVVGAAQGQVQLTTPGQVGRIAQSGQPVFLGDQVTTDAKAHLQILLLDETVFTIGPNSAITIDRFVYDPSNHKGEIKASVAKGVFRYVSGKIAVKNPNKVTVKLPTSTIGFRGTIVGGLVGPDGQGLVGLLGPGDNNDSGAQTGSFTIEGEGGDHQDVNRTGFGVEVGADGGLSDVFQLSDDQISGLTGGLGGGQGGGGNQGGDGDGGGLGGDTDMGDLSGENDALTGENGDFSNGSSNFGDGMNDLGDDNAQKARDLSGEAASTDNTTTYEQLLAATTEPSHYANSGSYSGGSGGYTYGQANMVFGLEGSIGSGNSYIEVSDGFNTDRTTSIGDGGTSFAGKSGPTTDLSWRETASSGGIFDFTAKLSNSSDGVIAQNVVVNVTYTQNPLNSSTTPVSGSGTVTGTLSPGALPPSEDIA